MQTMGQWIKVEEWIPEEGAVCLVCDSVNQWISLGRHIGDNSWDCMSLSDMQCDTTITHWMEIPPPPEAED